MLIFIKTKTGKTLSLDVEKEDLVRSVKAKIADRESVSVLQLNLVYAGKPLEDDKSLGEYAIDREAIVHLILKDLPKVHPPEIKLL